MKLRLVKQDKFMGTKCDFYIDDKNNIYMSRTQVGYALQYKNPQDAIRSIHQRHHERLDKFSIEVTTAQIERVSKHQSKDKLTFMYSEKGIYEICRYSRQAIANEFFDWLFEIANNIRVNGFYIATEKDEKWLGIRQKSKLERRSFTDEVQEFVEYAKQHGSSKPEMYYKHFTKLVNDKLSIPKGAKRDDLSQSQLMDIMALERVVSMKLPKLITEDIDYHEVYKKIKELISII